MPWFAPALLSQESAGEGPQGLGHPWVSAAAHIAAFMEVVGHARRAQEQGRIPRPRAHMLQIDHWRKAGLSRACNRRLHAAGDGHRATTVQTRVHTQEARD